MRVLTYLELIHDFLASEFAVPVDRTSQYVFLSSVSCVLYRWLEVERLVQVAHPTQGRHGLVSNRVVTLSGDEANGIGL